MKRYLTSLFTREMAVKSTMRHYYISLEWLKFKRLTMSNIGDDV